MSAPRPIPRAELFDPEFLASLEGLRVVARRVPRHGRHAEQRSADLGVGLEFRDFRPYAPGDDFRAIDWNIYRRLGRVFLRLFEELEDLPLYLMPDTSDSMFAGPQPRAFTGLRATLALAAIGLHHHDTAGVFPFGAGLAEPLRPGAGRARVLRIADYLAGLAPAGPTDVARALRELRARRLRPGLLAVVSDFFDPAGLDGVFAELKRMRHRLLLVPLARAADRDPGLTGDVRLRDCETGATADVTVTAATLARVAAAHDEFHARLASFARARGAGLWPLDAGADVVPQLATLFRGGRFQA